LYYNNTKLNVTDYKHIKGLNLLWLSFQRYLYL